MHEGIFVYGIILSRKSTDLLAALLRFIVEEFEGQYWNQRFDGIEQKAFIGFDITVRKYFEFDMPSILID